MMTRISMMPSRVREAVFRLSNTIFCVIILLLFYTFLSLLYTCVKHLVLKRLKTDYYVIFLLYQFRAKPLVFTADAAIFCITPHFLSVIRLGLCRNE